MLKLTASFSKKVPVAGAEYSSQQYHAAVEVELPDGLTPEQLQGRIHQTFSLVQASVENELRNGQQASVQPAATIATAPQPTPASGKSGTAGASGVRDPKASGKQVQFLTDLALRRGLDLQALNAIARRVFGVAELGALTRKQASDFIDRFDALVKPEGRAAA